MNAGMSAAGVRRAPEMPAVAWINKLVPTQHPSKEVA